MAEDSNREELEKLRHEINHDLHYLMSALHKHTLETNRRFNQFADRLHAWGRRTNAWGERTERLARQMARMARKIHQQSLEIHEQSLEIERNSQEIRQASADSDEQWNQLAGRMRLLEQRHGSFLGVAEGERHELRGLLAALDERVSRLENERGKAS